MPESRSSVSPIATYKTTDQNSKSFERDSEFWFKGGDIIVVAQKTAFRFHKDVVSLHSSASPNIFSKSQHSESLVPDETTDKTSDGCPVVRASDTSSDFRELLRAMYYGIRYLHPRHTVTFPVLAALARLSHKYQFNALFAAVICRLERIFPTKLNVWDRGGGLNRNDPHRLSSTEVIEALNLFRLINRPNMIPTALYRCAQLGPHSILCGEMRADGVTRERLSLSDMELCIKLKEKLLKVNARLLIWLHEACDARFRKVYEKSTDCLYLETCKRGLRSAIRKCLRDIRKYTSTDPLNMCYIPAMPPSLVDGDMCHMCGDVLETAYFQEPRKIWAELPGIMGVNVDNWNSA